MDDNNYHFNAIAYCKWQIISYFFVSLHLPQVSQWGFCMVTFMFEAMGMTGTTSSEFKKLLRYVLRGLAYLFSCITKQKMAVLEPSSRYVHCACQACLKESQALLDLYTWTWYQSVLYLLARWFPSSWWSWEELCSVWMGWVAWSGRSSGIGGRPCIVDVDRLLVTLVRRIMSFYLARESHPR